MDTHLKRFTVTEIVFALSTTALALLFLCASVAYSDTVFVPPGPGTPVQDAIDAATPGDTIRLSVGQYEERIVVTKALTIRGVRSASTKPNDITVLSVPCGGGPVVEIAADVVKLMGIAVMGGDGGVQIVGRDLVTLKDVLVNPQCPLVTAPGFNIENSAHVSLKKLWAWGTVFVSSTAQIPGIRIAATPPDGLVKVVRSASGHSTVGLLLVDNPSNTVQVKKNHLNFNVQGIFLENTDGAKIIGNGLVDNSTTGIETNADSTGNLIRRNRISGSVNDVLEGGSGNCWRDNTFTSGTVPLCP